MKKKYLMNDDYVLDKVLEWKRLKNKKLRKIWWHWNFNWHRSEDKFPYYIFLKDAVILMTYVINDGDKFFPQVFLEETLLKA